MCSKLTISRTHVNSGAESDDEAILLGRTIARFYNVIVSPAAILEAVIELDGREDVTGLDPEYVWYGTSQNDIGLTRLQESLA